MSVSFPNVLSLGVAAGLALAGGAVGGPVPVVPAPVETAADLDALLPVTVETASAARTLAIPEPVSLAIFGTGLLLLFRRRRF